MGSFSDLLHKSSPLLGDGAMGTELQKRGLPAGACPEEWNLSHPEIVQAIHRDYYRAGSVIVETNTFGANRVRLKEYGLENQVATINHQAAQLARAVCPAHKYVAGSIGPSGETLTPLGSLETEQAYEIFAEQAKALYEGGVDLIIVETMMDLKEAELAVRAVKDHTPLPVAATLTYQTTPAGPRTPWGVSPAQQASAMNKWPVDLIGANCSEGVEIVLTVIQELAQHTNKPLIAQPNAGVPLLQGEELIYSETPQTFYKKIQPFFELPLLKIIGGCCGTGPEHIALIRQHFFQEDISHG